MRLYNRDPGKFIKYPWIPACAGMTEFLMGQPCYL